MRPRDPEPRGPVRRSTRTVVILVTVALAAVIAIVLVGVMFAADAKSVSPGHVIAVFAGLQVLAWFALAIALGRRRARTRAAAPAPTLQPTRAPDCPFCKATLGRADPTEGVLRCPACDVALHAGCWRENGGCATLGCARAGTGERRERMDPRGERST